MRRFRGEKRKANVPEGAPAPKEMRDEIREYCSGVLRQNPMEKSAGRSGGGAGLSHLRSEGGLRSDGNGGGRSNA